MQLGFGVGSREEKDRKAMGQVGHSEFPFKGKRKFKGTSKQIHCIILLTLRVFGYEYKCSPAHFLILYSTGIPFIYSGRGLTQFHL